jgi:hypothetical protein
LDSGSTLWIEVMDKSHAISHGPIWRFLASDCAHLDSLLERAGSCRSRAFFTRFARYSHTTICERLAVIAHANDNIPHLDCGCGLRSAVPMADPESAERRANPTR